MAMKMLNGKQPKSMQSFMRSLFHRLSSEGILYSVYSIFFNTNMQTEDFHAVKYGNQ